MMTDFPSQGFSKGDVIFEEGAAADVAYILDRGSIEISALRKGHKIILAVLKPGAIFGEMALVLSDQKRTATAKALEDSEVTVINKSTFYKYLMNSSPVIRTLVSDLVDRLYKTTAMLVETDDLSVSICQMFRLLTQHQVPELDYEGTVNVFSRCFRINPDIIQDKLEQLAKSDLLEFTVTADGKKAIKANRSIMSIEA
jgi:CRP-like cAMP-binding protein